MKMILYPWKFQMIMLHSFGDGEQLPYCRSVKIVDGDNSWMVTVERNTMGPVFGDGFTKVVRDSGLKKKDYLLFQAFGTSAFFLSVYRECVYINSFITKIRADDAFILMPGKYRRDFYGPAFEGGPATLYIGDRFWNVKMEGWSDMSAFTDGWSNLIDDLALDNRSTFVFTMAGYKCFEVYVFNHQTGTEIYFKKIELIVLDDSIYDSEECDFLIAEHMDKLNTGESDVEKVVVGDSVNDCLKLSLFDSIFNDIDDSNFDLCIGSLIDKEDANILVDRKGKAKVFVDEERLPAEVDRKGKAKVLVDDERLSAEEEIKFDMALEKFLIPKNKEHVDLKGKSTVVVCDKKLSLEVGNEANL